MSPWPKDDPRALAAFYGNPAKDEVAQHLIRVIPPFQMYYEGKPIKGFLFHKKAAGACKAALDDIWEHYGQSQKRIDAEGISKFGGSYNRRLIRGSKSRWSNHAYGAAIDLDVEDNQLGTEGDMPQAVIDAFEAQGAKWGGTYKGRKDPMHFEFVDNGKPMQAVAFADLPDDDKAENDGAIIDDEKTSPLDTIWKLLKSKTQWAATGAFSSSLLAFLTDWKVWAVIIVGILCAYIIYERSKK